MAELIPHVRVQKNSCLIEIYTFQVTVRFLCSDNVSRRCSCSGTIGALASVVLLFLNARPVVSDERSEEFRRSVKESLNGPVQANRSDGIKPGIGIERKNIPTYNLALIIVPINKYLPSAIGREGMRLYKSLSCGLREAGHWQVASEWEKHILLL